jgi:hypothetical protein
MQVQWEEYTHPQDGDVIKKNDMSLLQSAALITIPNHEKC